MPEEPDEKLTPVQAAILRRNLRRARPVIALVLVVIAAALQKGRGAPVWATVIYLAVFIPGVLWYVTRSVNKLIRDQS